MATKTAFTLTDDNSTTSYPDDGAGWSISNGNDASQAEGRYRSMGLENVIIAFPSGNDDGYNYPKMRFIFLNAYGQKISGSPSIYLRLPSNFNVTGFSDYSRTEAIFSGGATEYTSLAQKVLGEKAQGATGQALDAIGKAGITGIEALQYALTKGAANLAGFVGSAGLSNIGQYEFNQRRSVNPMAQLLYKGPQFRRYQLPFVVRPRNSKDSDNIRKIIGAFRVASSPSVPSTAGTSIAGVTIGSGNSFTFGYPHLTQFTVGFIDPANNQAKSIFRSKVCVIESVAVDYGGQKITFFEDGSPTEMNFTIQLTEVMPRTLGDSLTDAKDANIKLS